MAKKRRSAKNAVINVITLLSIGFCSAVFTFASLNIAEWYRDNRATNDIITSVQDSAKITENNGDAERLRVGVGEKGWVSFNKIQEQSKIEIEQKNIQMLIFQRSLYIMKQRFSQNKKETELVYDKYKNSNYKSLQCISTQKLFECYVPLILDQHYNLSIWYQRVTELERT